MIRNFHRWLDDNETVKLLFALMLGMSLSVGMTFANSHPILCVVDLILVGSIVLSRFHYIRK